MTVRKQRWRGVRVEENGRRVAYVRDQETGEEVGVHFHLGRWRRYKNDEPVHDPALAGCARRLLA